MHLCGFSALQSAHILLTLDVRCIYYMLHVIIGHCGRYEVRVHNWSYPLAGAAHRSERRWPLISPTSSRCSDREREECKWVHSRKPSPAPSTLKSPLALPGRDVLQTPASTFFSSDYWGQQRQVRWTERGKDRSGGDIFNHYYALI